ncbi:MAG: hypothetical protein NTW86_01075 [Candidatus Sumerlaeota bacterium]|nr:hypothetical protein [Candidatus Sumerlaeota bacterium]
MIPTLTAPGTYDDTRLTSNAFDFRYKGVDEFTESDPDTIDRPDTPPPPVLTQYVNPDFEANVNRELIEVSRLKPNWDGYGAPAIPKPILTAARKILRPLAKRSDIPTPYVVALMGGRLQFEWYEGEKCLEIEVETSERAHYLKSDPDHDIDEEDVYRLSDTERTIGLIKWFLGEA